MNPHILALIPHYNHPKTIAQVVAAMRDLDLTVLVVDDGSRDECHALLRDLVSEHVHVVFRSKNGGKGAAVKTGLWYAEQHRYTHVLQVDADAQHNLNDSIKLIQAARDNPQAVICAQPQYSDDAPKSRLYGRKITDFWNGIHTLSTDIKDGMCGFRLYPLAPCVHLLRTVNLGDRMDFDNEILVRLHWLGVPFIWIKTPVRYEAGGVSHFRAWEDNVLISKMHARLFFGMLLRCFGLKRDRLPEK
ncbi:MAG: glycosyltransferase family 2 protein [Alysiella sp.]|uniref:glycosyltransferase family 2 protein n=1 Tax=Alysiella sp. TaxID=1872483 RepID=UPI0026DA8075|nr:glycosyltransferase family 2 protein [Alysiella sp.]MDO4433399.1 glycosyltransferase family 2 protein [Alysiella sp.]